MAWTGRRGAGLWASLLGLAVAAHGPALAQSAEELQQRIEALETENQRMKRQMDAMKRQLDALSGQTAPKPVKMVERGEEDVTLKVSGQVNRAVLLGDDGSTTFASHVDNDHSSTRMRFDAAGRIDDDLTVKSRIEVELQINPSDTVPAGGGLQTHTNTLGDFRARKAYVALESRTFGRLALGQESVANDGATQ